MATIVLRYWPDAPAPALPAVAEVLAVKLRRLFGRDDGSAAGDPPDEDTSDGPVEAEPEADPGEVVVDLDEVGDGDTGGTDDETGGASAAGGAGDEGDDEGDSGEGDGGEGRDGFEEVQFELADWGAQERKLLDEILNGVRVRRVWQAGTLVVAARDAEVVDDLIDEIEERASLNLAPGVEPVVYDVRDWPDGLEDRFVEALIEGRIAHMRGYQEITIGVDDEETVDALVEEVTSAWEDERPDEGEEDEPDAQEVLSELFVTADRLLHDASDTSATVRFDDAADAVTTMRLPFGFAEGDWSAIKDAVEALRELLGDAKAQDTDIEEAASALRSLLRPLV